MYLKYSSKIDDISARVQAMVAKINDRRSEDQKVMESFQETLAEKVPMNILTVPTAIYCHFSPFRYRDMTSSLTTQAENITNTTVLCRARKVERRSWKVGMGNVYRNISVFLT